MHISGSPALPAHARQHAARAPHQFEHARRLVLQYGWNTTAYQLLNPGMSYWFDPRGDALVGYVATQGYHVVAGEPVCAPERLAQVTAAFEGVTHQAGRRICYMAAQDRMVMIQDTSLPVAGLLLGAQPIWRPRHWADRLMRKASFRGQLARARNKQVSIDRWESERATNHAALRRCLHEWLQQRRMPPMHFLVEPDTLGQLRDREVFVAERHRQVIGFLIASPVPCRRGWLIEQIIRTRAAPNGTTELLLDYAMRHLAAIGADYVTLGLSPLSRRAGLAQTAQTGSVRLLLSGLRAYGQRFYNFEGLDAYKAKFLPEWWEPVYAISREQHISLRTLYAIAGAFGGTSPLLYIGHSMLWAAGQELRTAGQRLRRL